MRWTAADRWGGEAHQFMRVVIQEALRITAEINGSDYTPEGLRELFSRLIGKPVDPGSGLLPPFHTHWGKNIPQGRTCLSIWAANSRIREEFASGTAL